MPAHAYNKLKAKMIGPLEVLERINDNFNFRCIQRQVLNPLCSRQLYFRYMVESFLPGDSWCSNIIEFGANITKVAKIQIRFGFSYFFFMSVFLVCYSLLE